MAAGVKVSKNGKKSAGVKPWESVRKEIVASPKNYNKLVTLLNTLKEYVADVNSVEVKEVRVLMYELYKVFEYFVSKQAMKVRKGQSDGEQQVSKWINAKYESYYELIYSIWNVDGSDDDESLATIKLDALEHVFKLLAEEAKYLKPSKDEAYFPNVRYRALMDQILRIGNEDDAREDGTISEYVFNEFQEKYFNEYWDLKYYFYQEFSNLKDLNSVMFAKLLTITKQNELYDVTNTETITSAALFVATAPTNTIYSLNTFRIQFEKAWLHGLNNNENLTRTEHLATLNVLHKRIIPYCSDAAKLLDFLTASYTLGLKRKDILVSILALNGLWALMRDFNLEYPDFYKNLYAILTPELMHLTEKSRFFRLLEVFMSSTHLSASIVASFIKRLARLSLTAPPSGIVAVVPFVYNMMRKHGHTTCVLLIQSTTSAEEDANYVDPYDAEEVDPAMTMAIESSVWELASMVNHYHPNVAALMKIFQQKMTKHGYNLEDFLDWSYEKLLDAEQGKALKGEIGIEFEKWSSMFETDDDANNAYMPDYIY